MEADRGAQMEDQRQWVRLLPAFGHRRREMKAGVARHQAIKEQLVDVLRLRVRSHARVKAGRTALDEEDHGLRVAGRCVAARERRKQH